MRKVITTRMKLFAIALALAVVSGCGSASNNDQGVSFPLFGFYGFDESGALDTTTQTSERDTTLGGDTEIAGDDGSVRVGYGVTNNLDGQTIRLERAYLSYVIPGATTQPPDTSVATSGILAPTINSGNTTLPGTGGGSTGSSSGGTGTGVPTTLFKIIPVVPAPIRQWLNLHRNELPELPFEMEAIVYIRGVTSAGAVLDTNTATLRVNFTPDQVIEPTPGTTSSSSASEVDSGDNSVE